MKYRRLGKTNLTVSVVGIGTWQYGGEWGKDFTPEEVARILARGRDLGINLIDTAECYGDHLSESLIGQAIQRERDKWVVATKFGHKFHGHMNRTDERSAADMEKQLEESLRALRTDYVDLLQFHSVRDSEFENAELHEALRRVVKAGKVRHVGNSVGSASNAVRQIDGSPAAGVEVIQIIYNRLDRAPEESGAFASCQRQDLGVLARVPLASGLLSGKYKPGATRFGGKDYRAGQDPQKLDEKLREVQRIGQEEVPPNTDMATWALAWCLRHPAVTSVIPGCKSVEQVESNARAADLADDSHPQAVKR